MDAMDQLYDLIDKRAKLGDLETEHVILSWTRTFVQGEAALGLLAQLLERFLVWLGEGVHSY